MRSDRRTEEEIRREIASEREQLAVALADLHEGIHAKRRLAAIVAGLLAAAAAVGVVRRLTNR